MIDFVKLVLLCVLTDMGKKIRACLICGDSLIAETPAKQRITNFPSTQYFRIDEKILEEMIIVKFDAIIDENFCGSLCVFDPSCKSFNYNVAVKQCQLLASDLHLKNKTKPDLDAAGIWIHQTPNKKVSRGCPDDSLILSDCVGIWVESFTTNELVVGWREPSDEDERTEFSIDKYTIEINNTAHRGQSADFEADSVMSTLTSSRRRHVFSDLIPGMKYNVELKAFYQLVHEIQFPLPIEQSLTPERPVLGGLDAFEKKFYLNWTLEGAADTFQIWNTPADGSCATLPEGYCEVDVKTKEIYITELVAGKEYTIFVKSVSHGKESLILEVVHPTFTDVTSIDTTSSPNTPKQFTIYHNTASGVGWQHEVFIDSRGTRVVPRLYNFPFQLSQVWDIHHASGNLMLQGGVFYTINITAYSQGETPVVRKYYTEEITYPEKPIPDGEHWTSTTRSVTIKWTAAGFFHGFELGVGAQACFDCSLASWQRTYTIDNLQPGEYYDFMLTAHVTYDGITLKGLPMVTDAYTYPEAPTVVDITSGCDSGQVRILTEGGSRIRVIDGNNHFLITPRTNSKTVRIKGLAPETHYQFFAIVDADYPGWEASSSFSINTYWPNPEVCLTISTTDNYYGEYELNWNAWGWCRHRVSGGNAGSSYCHLLSEECGGPCEVGVDGRLEVQVFGHDGDKMMKFSLATVKYGDLYFELVGDWWCVESCGITIPYRHPDHLVDINNPL
ncbi:uncharacterized protein LOC134848777 [Symsagittifera roscoffensis]|uniref:uncharacterized protein LOC134848777 n=1 Tax=Symsagittifera roscoffensis TaxID=84072 RepID=UPI00307B4A54